MVSSRSAALFWPITAMRRFSSIGSAATSTPATSARPAVGVISEVSMPIVVDLPAPLGPISPKHSPGRTSRSTPSTACTSPAAVW